MIILASRSAVRARLLEAAGVPFRVVSSDVDEDAVKVRLIAAGAGPRAIASSLAADKALTAAADPTDLIIGADQTLDMDGELMNKAETLAEARARLQRLRGRAHVLHAAVALARGGEVIWRAVSSPVMKLRSFSDAFLDCYLAEVGEAVLSSVGCYELEGRGAQLFERIEGDYFAVLGLPLIELLAAIRLEGALGE